MSFAVAILTTKPPTAVVIRKSWIYKFAESKTLNNGTNRNQIYSIFYSIDIDEVANFAAPITESFDPFADACYHAKIYRFFGKFWDFEYLVESKWTITDWFLLETEHEAYESKRRHRHTLPPLNCAARLLERPIPQLLRGSPEDSENEATEEDKNNDSVSLPTIERSTPAVNAVNAGPLPVENAADQSTMAANEETAEQFCASDENVAEQSASAAHGEDSQPLPVIDLRVQNADAAFASMLTNQQSTLANISNVTDGVDDLSLRHSDEDNIDEKPAKVEPLVFLNDSERIIEILSDDEDEEKTFIIPTPLTTAEWSAIDFIVTEEAAPELQESSDQLSEGFEFGTALPKPTEAKLQIDELSGLIPFTEDVSASLFVLKQISKNQTKLKLLCRTLETGVIITVAESFFWNTE